MAGLRPGGGIRGADYDRGELARRVPAGGLPGTDVRPACARISTLRDAAVPGRGPRGSGRRGGVCDRTRLRPSRARRAASGRELLRLVGRADVTDTQTASALN